MHIVYVLCFEVKDKDLIIQPTSPTFNPFSQFCFSPTLFVDAKALPQPLLVNIVVADLGNV